MSQISEKFCEECGKKSPIEVKYCKFCGVEFPAINHPQYIIANDPQLKNLPPGSPSQQFPPIVQDPATLSQNVPQQQQFPPQPPGQPGPYTNVPELGFFTRKPPRVWDGGGLVSASKSLYTKPEESVAGLIEDPQAPRSTWIIFLTAITTALLQYFVWLKTDIVDEIGDDQNFFATYNTPEGIQALATSAAIAGFVLVFLNWLIFSWFLAMIVKGGIPQDQHLQTAPSKSMRQFTGFLYIPVMFRNIAEIILLQFEKDREASIEKGAGFFGTTAPDIKYLTEYSDQFFLILFIAAMITSVIVAVTLYRSLRNGLKHNGLSPILVASFIIAYALYIYYPF